MEGATFAHILAVLAIVGGALTLCAFIHGAWSPNMGQYTVRVATTTSLYQIGAVYDLLGDFSQVTGLNVKFHVMVKGSGEALKLLEDGSACIALVHAPALELEYINRRAIERLAVFAYNEFVLVGPPDDPANVTSTLSAVEAFRRIYEHGEKGYVKFISRGDMSGTHTREIQLWRLAGVNPEGRSWYLKSGQGMAQTLLMAESLEAYTLSDSGTYLNLRNQGKLTRLTTLRDDPRHLVNVYSAYLSKSPACRDQYVVHVARELGEYLASRGQELLASRYRGLLKPVEGREGAVLNAWKELAELGRH